MTITAEQFKEAAKKAAAAGDVTTARKLIARAKSADVSYGREQVAANAAAMDPAARAENQAAIDNAADPGRPSPLVENLVGYGAPDTFGEQLGSQINAMGAGMARGAASLVGIPGTVGNLIDRGVEKGAAAMGLDLAPMPESQLSGAALQRGLSAATGGATEYRDPTMAGQFAGTVGEFIGGGAGVKMGAVAGAGSEAAGQLAKGTKAEPWARLVGAVVAPLGLAALQAGGRALAGLPQAAADAERLKLAKVLDDFGVPITAGQRLGADALRKAEGSTGAGQAVMDTQAQEFTRAALKAIGTDAPKATREVMDDAAARIGQVFDDVTRGVDVTPDAKTLSAMSNAMATYRQLAPKATEAPLLGNINREMVKAFRTGAPIPASTLTTWRSSLSKLTRSADAATRDAAIDALNAVDDAMGASLSALGRTADIGRLAVAREQWRNYLALQRAVTMAGEDAALGIISPARLASSITAQGRGAVATGKRGDIGALADAGVGVMSPLPSVTAGGVRSVPGVGAMLGGGAGAAVGGPLGAIAGMMAPAAVNALRMTGPVQNFLATQGAREGARIVDPNLLRLFGGATVER